jgi:hypothetical protein
LTTSLSVIDAVAAAVVVVVDGAVLADGATAWACPFGGVVVATVLSTSPVHS